MKNYSIVFLIVIGIHITSTAQNITLQEVATGLINPVEMVHAGDDRLFILEQDGVIKILENGAIQDTPFLNITANVNSSASERGLLGLAFSPNFDSNNYYFVYYTNISGNTTVSRFTANGNTTDISTEEIVLTVNQPYSNHNGGKIAFGPDGYLYIGLGDGGSGGDPNNYAQNTNSMLGKLLRIDVSSLPYIIPADNPFVSDDTVLDEIFAIGLRNPWKFSFDSANGDLWIGDVGQNAIEEIDHVSNASGLNFGWRCYEGNSTYNTSGCNSSSNYTFPVATYTHGGGKCSITGGYVYNGTEYTGFQNKYFFGDYCSGEIGVVDVNTNVLTWLTDTFTNISCFGEDANGNLYIANYWGGEIFKLKEVLSTEDIESVNPQFQIQNPIQNTLFIQSNVAITHLTLFSIEGKLLQEIDNKQGIQQITMDVSHYNEGIYLLEIQTENGKRNDLKKVIIRR